MSGIKEMLPCGIGDAEKIAAWIDQYGEEALLTRMEQGHFTAAGFIFNPQRTKALMIYHNIFKTWAWTGGHADGEADLLRVALKEAQEETGVLCRPIDGIPVSADILPVKAHTKRGKPVAAHVHLNLCYALECDENARVHIKPDENSGVGWIDLEKIPDCVSEEDAFILPIYRRIVERYSKVKW